MRFTLRFDLDNAWFDVPEGWPAGARSSWGAATVLEKVAERVRDFRGLFVLDGSPVQDGNGNGVGFWVVQEPAQMEAAQLLTDALAFVRGGDMRDGGRELARRIQSHLEREGAR